MRQILMTAFACASMLVAAPEKADAQVFIRPWLRPRVVILPRPFIPPFVAPSVVIQPPPAPVYYPPTYYSPPQPPTVYVQPPAPPQVYVQPQPPPPPPQVYVQPPAPPQVYVQPPPPPQVQVYIQPPAPPMPPQVEAQPLPQPPVYQAPPPPMYQAAPPPPPPAPVYQAPPPPPVYAAPVAFRAPALPQWQAKYGFGGRFTAAINNDRFTSFSQLGFGGELLFRTHRRLVIELAGEYQKRVDNGFDRYDVPVTLGMRVHIGAPDWVVSPYFVFAGGAAYSNLDYLHAHDIAWFLDGQLGGGLEIRLGKHVALTADLRGDARYRITPPDEATANTISIDGKAFAPMQNSYGLQARLGAAIYF